ncbi:hypothetical protein SAZ_31805 [Streptomyces noursei ZPM]|nr:hypothetical protein SAZ_31805 [Streptomyces noursei ZPM]
MQAGAPGVADGVDRLELDGDEPGDAGTVAVADHAVALDHVVAVGEPVPGVAEGVLRGVVVGVEDADELAADPGDGRVDVLRLGGGAGDRQQDQPGVAGGDRAEGVLDGQRVRGVVGEDDLQLAGVVLAQERLDGVDDGGGLVGEVRGDHGAGRRVGGAGAGRPGWRVQRVEALQDDQQRGEHQSGDHRPVHAGAEVPTGQVRLPVEGERHADAQEQGEHRGEGGERRADQGPHGGTPVAVRGLAHPGGVADGAQVAMAQRLAGRVAGLVDGVGGVGAPGEREPADGRGEADVLVGDDEAGAGGRGREVRQAAQRALLVDAGQQHQQVAVVVAAEPVADAAELFGDAGQPFGDLAADPGAQPLLQGGEFGDADDGEDPAVPGGFGAVEFAFRLVEEVRTGVEAGARVAQQLLDGDRHAAELGLDAGGEFVRIGGLGYAVVGALAEQLGDAGGAGGVGDDQERQRPAGGDGADLADDGGSGVPGTGFVEGDDGVRGCLADAGAGLAGRGVADVVAGGAQGVGEAFQAWAGGTDDEDVAGGVGAGGGLVRSAEQGRG